MKLYLPIKISYKKKKGFLLSFYLFISKTLKPFKPRKKPSQPRADKPIKN